MKTLFVVMMASCLWLGQQQGLPEVPSGDELKMAQKEVQQLYVKELSDRDPQKRRLLSQKLLDEAIRTKSEPTSCYALMLLASRVGASCGHMVVAIKAIEEAEATFENVPGDKLRSEVSKIARASCSKPTDLVALTGSYLQIFDAMVKREDYEHAAVWAKEALAVAKASRGKTAILEAMRIVSDAKDLRQAYAKVEKAKSVLKSKPNDPTASMDIGIYLLLIGEDPAAFLMLANSEYKQIQDAVEEESKYGGKAELALGVADKWIAASKKFRGYVARAMKMRASRILENAVSKLEGIQQTRIKNRMNGLGGTLNLSPLVGEWTMEHSRHGTKPVTIHEDGTLKAGDFTGKWHIADGLLKLRWDHIAGPTGSEWLKKESKLRYAGKRIYMCILTRR